jgi:hypothetical protein
MAWLLTALSSVGAAVIQASFKVAAQACGLRGQLARALNDLTESRSLEAV